MQIAGFFQPLDVFLQYMRPHIQDARIPQNRCGTILDQSMLRRMLVLPVRIGNSSTKM